MHRMEPSNGGGRAPLEDDDCSSSVRERVSGAYRASDASDGVKNTTDPSRALISAKRASIRSAYFSSKILTRQKNA